jgi:hypothetical protein
MYARFKICYTFALTGASEDVASPAQRFGVQEEVEGF